MFNAKVVHGFTVGMLAARYDSPKPVPKFHMEMWEDCCSDEQYVAFAAPRGHAKSTSITHAYGLAALLLQQADFALIVSDTETQAAEFLGDMKAELLDNDALRQTFKVKKMLKDSGTDFICQMADGRKFRVLAKGSEQKLRGIKWRNRRPNLILMDDLENDEIVMNPARREKFRKWFMNALLPCGSDKCLYRYVGTILHLDSMLNRILDDPEWHSRLYEAHNPDFTETLWPEKFPRSRLEAIRRKYEAQNNLDGYAQEYLNRPIAADNAYFNKDYFFDVDRNEDGSPAYPNLEYYAAADFAISEAEKADYTVIMVAGIDPDGYVYIVDVRRFRGDAERIIDELIATQKMWKPNIFTFETEKIDKALGPFLEREMRRTGHFLNINKVTPTKSKTQRGRSIQAMVKSGSVRFDKKASWYPDMEGELLTVSDSGPRGAHDDYFDAFAYIGLTIDEYFEAFSDKELEEIEEEEIMMQWHEMGRCATTGY
jgi:predicted phage terminase large subunit-like protein